MKNPIITETQLQCATPTIDDLLIALRSVYTRLDGPVHHNEFRSPAACDLLRNSASDARAIARAAIARAQDEEE